MSDSLSGIDERLPDRGQMTVFLDDATALSPDERAEVAKALATRGDGAMQGLAARLLRDWDSLSPLARTAGLAVLAGALSWRTASPGDD
jgi:hypothetical protein